MKEIFLAYWRQKQDLLKKSIDIDKKVWQDLVDLNKLEDIMIEFSYLLEDKRKTERKYILIFDGTPELTMQIGIKALYTDSDIHFLVRGEYARAINTSLISLFSSFKKRQNIPGNMDICFEYDVFKFLRKYEKDDYEIIFIGNRYDYERLKALSDRKIHCYFWKYLQLYVENEQNYKDILDTFRKYEYETDSEIERYDSLSFKQALEKMANPESQHLLLLSDDENHIKEFKEKFPYKNAYVNQNPFKDYKINIDDKLFI